jgi:hypothetical protein
MKARYLGALAALLIFPVGGYARGDIHVHGYFRSNGTYVQPYYRSAPDHSYNNNWSTRPNINPYTGKEGTHQPTWNNRPPSRTNPYGTAYSNPYSGSQHRSHRSDQWRY